MTLKEKIRNKVKTLGTWITVPHRSFVELAIQNKFDWVCIDIEHSSMNIDQVGTLISVAKAASLPALVRIYDNDPVVIKRVMDSGADGLIVPMINTVEQVKAAFASMHYPPLGKRGVGLARAQEFGASLDLYKEKLKKESILIAQIEHIDAVRNIDAIMACEELDGYLVGPYDLSASLGYPGDFSRQEFADAMNVIKKYETKAGKARGIHVVDPDHSKLEQALNDGFDFVAYSFETRVIERAFFKAREVVDKQLQ